MRITFYEPAGGLQPDIACNALALAGVKVRQADVAQWTRLELLLAYDWAMREHLGASDNPVRRRDCPHFVRLAESALAGAL